MELIGIALIEPSKHPNLGLIVRTMAAFGIERLAIIGNVKERVIKKATEIAEGGKYILENNLERYNSLDELPGKKIGTISIYDNEKYGFKLIPIFELNNLNGKYWIVFGRESSGMSKEELEKCDIITTIPTNWKYGVLNLATSVIITIYELSREKLMEFYKKYYLNRISD